MSNTSLVPVSEKKPKKTASSAIDSTNETQVPVDFSFIRNSRLEDYENEVPNTPPKKTIPVDQDGKWLSCCLKLNNCGLSDIQGLTAFVSNKFANPHQLAWLDLSFNDLKAIDDVLVEFTGLKMLYLHGNQIEKYTDVDKLTCLTSLLNLTLHGNPCENQKDYKHHVITMLPTLKKLDFTRITKHNKKTAETITKMSKGANKKQKDKLEDDD